MGSEQRAYDRIDVTRTDDERIVRIALDAPDAGNVIDLAMLSELNDAIRWADTEESVGGVILGSTSDDVFCAGADLTELSTLDTEGAYRFLATYTDTVDVLWQSGKPIVAAVPGDCVAGGNELAIGCDLIVAGASARFGQPEAGVGSTAAGGGVQLLPLLVGMQRTKDLLFTGRLLSAAEAEEWGLINRVVPDDEVDEAAVGLVTEILDGKSPYAYRVMKAALKGWYNTAMARREVEREVTAAVWTDEAFRERSREFLDGSGFSPRAFVGTTSPARED